MKKWTTLFFVFALVLSLGAIVAVGCGDDDDDDDDDDDVEVDKTACHEYDNACLGDVENFCASLYDNQSACMVEAADALFECLGTDCSKYEECYTVYGEEALDC